MDKLFKKMQEKGVLLDTNLLVLLVVGMADQKSINTHKKLGVYSLDDFRLLVATLGTCRKFVVTPHVLAETSNLVVHGMYGDLEKKAFLAIQGLLQVSNFSETHDYLSTIVSNDGFLKYGVSDIGLLEALKGELVLLTDDFQLSGYAEGKGYDVLNYQNLQYLIAEFIAKNK
jgi:hypothetical protein